MAYVPVPKDLSNVKTKLMFGLTKRQLVCFASGAAVAVPLFFILKSRVSTTTAALVMIFVLLPFFLLAMYEKNGQPLEKVARNLVNSMILRPKRRVYRTKNYYACLEKQSQIYTEVHDVSHD